MGIGQNKKGIMSMTVVLALFAVLVPASVTLVGYWIQRQAGKRVDLQKDQENARLKLDQVMRAAELFSSSDDTMASRERYLSALLALTQLDHAALAIGILADLWPAQSSPSLSPAQETTDTSAELSAEQAILVIHAALASKEPTAQVMAAELIARHAGMLDINSPLHWPNLIKNQWVVLPETAKLLLIDALIFMALVSQPSEVSFRTLAVRLYGIWENDPEPRVRHSTGAFIEAILPALEKLGYSEFMRGLEQGAVTVAQMRQAAATTDRDSDEFFDKVVTDRSTRLRQWSASHSSIPSPGTLASPPT
jgi:hypothetical protein